METNEKNRVVVPSTMRVIFGIIMIVIYIGMGVLLFCNLFDWDTQPWSTLRWVFGGILVLYGIWRAIRQFKGIDSSL